MRPQTPYPSDEDASAGPAWVGLLPGQPTAVDEATTEVPVIGPVAGTADARYAPTADDNDAEDAVTVRQAMPVQDGPEPVRAEGADRPGDGMDRPVQGIDQPMVAEATAPAIGSVVTGQDEQSPGQPTDTLADVPPDGGAPSAAVAQPVGGGASPFGLPPGAPAIVPPAPRPTPAPQPVPGVFHPRRPTEAPKPPDTSETAATEAVGSAAETAEAAAAASEATEPASRLPEPTVPKPAPAMRESANYQRPGDVAADPIAVWSEEAARLIRDRWRDLQVQFIDDPDAAVRGAKNLVTEAVRTLSDRLLAERDEFDPHRDTDRPGTEAMRVAMRRYREFLDRVLAL